MLHFGQNVLIKCLACCVLGDVSILNFHWIAFNDLDKFSQVQKLALLEMKKNNPDLDEKVIKMSLIYILILQLQNLFFCVI